MPIQPYPMYFESTVKELQSPYLGWVGKTGYELAEKHKEVINQFHAKNRTPGDCAKEINRKYMDRAISYNPIAFMKAGKRIKNVG